MAWIVAKHTMITEENPGVFHLEPKGKLLGKKPVIRLDSRVHKTGEEPYYSVAVGFTKSGRFQTILLATSEKDGQSLTISSHKPGLSAAEHQEALKVVGDSISREAKYAPFMKIMQELSKKVEKSTPKKD
jgi:hypothetical protein